MCLIFRWQREVRDRQTNRHRQSGEWERDANFVFILVFFTFISKYFALSILWSKELFLPESQSEFTIQAQRTSHTANCTPVATARSLLIMLLSSFCKGLLKGEAQTLGAEHLRIWESSYTLLFNLSASFKLKEREYPSFKTLGCNRVLVCCQY